MSEAFCVIYFGASFRRGTQLDPIFNSGRIDALSFGMVSSL